MTYSKDELALNPQLAGEVAVPASRQLTVTLNHLPPAELSPNARVHWSVRHRATGEAKTEIGWLAKSQWHDDKPMMKACISWEFHFKDNRKHDLDNLHAACKAFQDGLIEVGVIFFDDAAHLEIGSIRGMVTGEEQTIVNVREVV